MTSQRLIDLMQSTAAEDDIKFYFITKSGKIDDASEHLKYSFQVCFRVKSNRIGTYNDINVSPRS